MKLSTIAALLMLGLGAAFSLFLAGCSSYPEAKLPELDIVLFNGSGERVEVEYNGHVVMNLRNIQTDDNNIAASKTVRRASGRSELLVKRNGLIAGRFFINPNRVGTIYLFLSPDGSVILEDGEKLPPLV